MSRLGTTIIGLFRFIDNPKKWVSKKWGHVKWAIWAKIFRGYLEARPQGKMMQIKTWKCFENMPASTGLAQLQCQQIPELMGIEGTSLFDVRGALRTDLANGLQKAFEYADKATVTLSAKKTDDGDILFRVEVTTD